MKENLKNYWLFWVTLLVALTIWVTHINHTLFFAINAWHTVLPVSVWKAITWLSGGSSLLPVTLIVLTALFRRDKLLNVILLLLVFSGVFECLKLWVHEARPYIQYDPSTFFLLPDEGGAADQLRRAYRSFPSGHSGNTAIFCFAMMHLFAQHRLWLRTVFIAFLAFAMLARICTGWHFPLDTLASALISFVLVKACMAVPFNEWIQTWRNRKKTTR